MQLEKVSVTARFAQEMHKILTRIIQGLLGIWDMVMVFTCALGKEEGKKKGEKPYISAWLGEQKKHDKDLVSSEYEHIHLRVRLLHRACMWLENCDTGKGLHPAQARLSAKWGEMPRNRTAVDPDFLNIACFLLVVSLGVFLFFFTLDFRCVTVLTDQTREAHTITPNEVVNPTMPTKCVSNRSVHMLSKSSRAIPMQCVISVPL